MQARLIFPLFPESFRHPLISLLEINSSVRITIIDIEVIRIARKFEKFLHCFFVARMRLTRLSIEVVWVETISFSSIVGDVISFVFLLRVLVVEYVITSCGKRCALFTLTACLVPAAVFVYVCFD